MKIEKVAAGAGLLGAACVVALTVVGAWAWPGYDHATQFISELGANGAPQATAVNYFGFLPAGLLISAFAVLAWRASPRSVAATLGMIGLVLYSIGYLAAAMFPCDFGCRPDEPSTSQVLHNLFGLAGYVFAPVTLFLLGLGARRWRGGEWLSWLGRFVALPALFGLLLLESTYAGAAQRVLEASVLAWVVGCAAFLWRRADD